MTRPPPRLLPRPSADDAAEMARLYAGPWGVNRIAERTGWSTQAVRRALRRAGLPPKPPGKPPGGWPR